MMEGDRSKSSPSAPYTQPQDFLSPTFSRQIRDLLMRETDVRTHLRLQDLERDDNTIPSSVG